ncbi:transaldolase family protein [Marispirochaeta aestuarii]|uniref:transaldolase family protein n=1 Tax=Marispirochaeta aestuarii TaxID=1963862 RepID=UPI0029C74766|nr:transaldolase family protein [Marispirochaeta aestuarii]
MNDTYFHEVQSKTPTRFWVNNPTPKEAVMAIDAGAEYCTTNPTYTSKMLKNRETREDCMNIMKEILQYESDDSLVVSRLQSRIVKKIMDAFLPVYEKTDGTRGWVSIQGDPEKEDDPSDILREAESNLSLSKNYIAKVPVTKSGISAIAELSQNDVPVIATEVMSVAQAIQVSEIYTDIAVKRRNPAPMYVTHITGIFDQHLSEWKKNTGAEVNDEILWYAGILAGRKLYSIIKEREYPVVILGGGARGLHHFTEFVGADMHITINWKGTADKLIKDNPPVENRFDVPIDDSITRELLEKVPLFKAAWEEDGLQDDEYSEFPPVVLFRNMFLDGWREAKDTVREVRNESQKN